MIDEPSPGPRSVDPRPDAVAESGMVVVAVDDEAPARAELAWLLSRDGRIGTVLTASDGADVLRLLESRSLDLTPWTEVRTLDEGQASFIKMTYDPGATLKLIFKP